MVVVVVAVIVALAVLKTKGNPVTILPAPNYTSDILLDGVMGSPRSKKVQIYYSGNVIYKSVEGSFEGKVSPDVIAKIVSRGQQLLAVNSDCQGNLMYSESTDTILIYLAKGQLMSLSSNSSCSSDMRFFDFVFDKAIYSR